MKFLKKLFLVGIFTLMTFCFINIAPVKANSADAVVVDESVFQYLTITHRGQVVDMSNFKTFGETSYLVNNDSLTIHIDPFKNTPLEYYVMLEEYTDHFETITETFELKLDELTGETYFSIPIEPTQTTPAAEESEELPTEKKYYVRIIPSTGVINIFNNIPSATSTGTPILTTGRNNIFTYDSENQTISYIRAYILKPDAPDTFFNFRMQSASTARTYSIGFLRPLVPFANDNTENLIRFSCLGLDAGNAGFVNETLRKELSYNSVKLDFLQNKYSEGNPLYFNINYNGFDYNFKLYSKVYDGEDLLFINYYEPEHLDDDGVKVEEAVLEYIGTRLFLNGNEEYVVDNKNKTYTYNESDFNYFSMLFHKTGRYEIEFYDSTYLLNFEEPNYYSTSFYIKDETLSAFENIHIVAQTQDDDGKDIEYIVSTSTLNHNVKTTVKNMGNLGNDAEGNPVKLADIIEKIEIKKTTFGGSSNLPTFTEYSPEEVLEQMKNGDFVLSFTDDAYYEISIYQKGTTEIIYYEFTIVKHAKTTFTIPKLDEDGVPITDEKGKPLTETYEASEAYKTEPIDYKKTILSNMDLTILFSKSGKPHEVELDKRFVNKYRINYGVQAVKIEKYERELAEGEKKVDSLDLQFMGVGELTVTVTVNHNTTVYTLNYEENNYALTFTEYGTYTIKLVDSMGTETVSVFTLSKKLNTSAIVLIGLSSLIVLVIILFVLKARGKVATR